MIEDSEISEDTLREIRDKPSFFVEKVCDKTPYPYQKEFLDADAGKQVFVAGRQVGKSTSLVWKALHLFATKPDQTILMFSPTKRQAIELFHEKLKDEIPEWIDNPGAYGLLEVNKSEIRGVNGSRIKALPATASGKTIRGFTADMIIADEAASFPNEVFTSVLAPMLLTTSGDFVLAGTPWGRQGFFWDKWEAAQKPDTDWERYRVPTTESPEVDRSYIKDMKKSMTKDEFKREILAEFTTKGNAAFPEELIKDCRFGGHDRNTGRFPKKSTGECYLGGDIATGGKSKAVFTSLDASGHVFDVDDDLEEATIPQIEGKVEQLNRKHNYDAIRLDMTGLGEGVVSNLEDRIRALEGVRFTLNSKEAMYNNLKKIMEEGELTIPDYDPLVEELKNMELDQTPRGRTKVQPPENGSDDYFDSLMLAADGYAGGSKADPATGEYILDSGKKNRNTQNSNRTKNGSWTF